MTCLWRARFLLPGLPPEALVQLERHAASCEECAGRRAKQIETFALLQEDDVDPMHPFERTRLWANIESARRETTTRRPWFAWAALAGAVFVVGLFIAASDAPPSFALRSGHARGLDVDLAVEAGDPPPRGAWLVLDSGSVVELRQARFVARTRVVFSVPEAPEVEELWISSGTLHVDAVEALEPRTIVTQAGRLRVFAGQSRLQVMGDQVELEVASGRVDLEPMDGVARTAREGVKEQLAPPRAVPPSLPPPQVPAAPPPPVRTARPRPRPSEGIEALMSAADLDRRSGRLAEAAGKYARAAEHPSGAPFLEEALMRRASILFELGEVAPALELLERAERRVGRGKLGPERAALEARLWLARGDAPKSASVLERWSGGSDRVLDLARLDVARALLARDPQRAEALLDPTLEAEGDLGERARRLAREARP